MKKLVYLLFLLTAFQVSAQKLFKPAPAAGEILPDWAIEMYSDNPNVWEVEAGYQVWRQAHPKEKTTFSQYYKKWRRAALPYTNQNGVMSRPNPAETAAFRQQTAALKGPLAGNWSSIGPFETFNTNTGPNPLAKSSQANVYTFDQSPSDPNILYCGTEGSEAFKSIDKGLNWTCISRNYDFQSPTAIEVHPTNPDVVYIAEGPRIRKSTDGGASWSTVLEVADLGGNEILVNPADPQIVLAATFKGLYRSTDAGETWIRLFPEASYDIEWKADDPSTAFLVRNDPAAQICRFYKSTDNGLTWTLKDNGWFFSNAAGRNDGGARLAVTKADPNRVYAVLIGEAKTDDSGFIGIWRSDDGGETWTLPNGPAGGPWNGTTHPNLATINLTGGYHQGFYNLGFDASDSNPDQLLAGFLKLWSSSDGAASFTCIGGYCNNDFNYVHPDCQEIEINDGDVWMCSDGGIEYSNDFFDTHFARNRGITSVDFWGFATGWNEDVLVGGRYHNGNTGWYQDWQPGECLSLGGAESATGYVNPGANRRTYFSDIGGVVLPEEQNGFTEYFYMGKYPNESYYDAESGEMEWDPRCWNTFYVTEENKLRRTTTGGNTWNVVYSFGTDVNARTRAFEISRSNPNVMYLFQAAAYTWDPGKLWKTTNGGTVWTELALPPGYARRMVMTLSPEDENLLWVAYPDGDNGQKVYKTTNGGQTWINITTSALNNEHITSILHQGGTDGVVYLGTYRTIWVRDDAMNNWATYNEGLPVSVTTCILRPFYRDNKLRLGAYSKGIWETPFFAPSRPVAQPMVNKRSTNCPGDTLLFDDYSMLDHAGATWSWSFPGGVPATSNLRNPKVVYNAPGEFDVTLTVTNPNGTSTKTVVKMVKILPSVVNDLPVVNDFSGGLGNLTVNNPDAGITWEPVNITTCNPNGDTAYYVHNFTYGDYGQDELVLPINLDLTQIVNPVLTFRAAYAPYYDGGYFIDSLKVLVSANCGDNFITEFRSGGEALSTTTSGNGDGNYYENEEFSPQNCEEWREITLDLSAYEGKFITVKFRNESGYGNNMYVDDISLTGENLVKTNEPIQLVNIQLSPNPTANTTTLQGTARQTEKIQLQLHNATGVQVWSEFLTVNAGKWEHPIPMATLPSGVYGLKITDQSGHVSQLKVVKIHGR